MSAICFVADKKHSFSKFVCRCNVTLTDAMRLTCDENWVALEKI